MFPQEDDLKAFPVASSLPQAQGSEDCAEPSVGTAALGVVSQVGHANGRLPCPVGGACVRARGGRAAGGLQTHELSEQPWPQG